MEVRKKYLQRLSLIFLLGYLLYGCCGPSFIVKEIKYKPPIEHWIIPSEIYIPPGADTIVARIDTIFATKDLKDTLYPVYTGVKLNEKGDTAVLAQFNLYDYSFDIIYYPDTIKFTDTIEITSSDIPFRGDTIWEKIVWMLSGLFAAGIIWYIKKKKK